MTLQDKICKLMDKTNKRYREHLGSQDGEKWKYRLEGMAATLAILRNIPRAPSSIDIEIANSNERCGYDND